MRTDGVADLTPERIEEAREVAERIVGSGWTTGPERETLARAFLALLSESSEREKACPICGHEWRRHDPEDGCCDAHSEELIGVCQCGRDMAWMHAKTAALSRAALAGSPSEKPGPPEGYVIPEGDERCDFVMDACTCMKRKGHDGLHACAHGGWRSPSEKPGSEEEA